MIRYSVKLRANTSRIQKDGCAALYLQVIIAREVKPLPLDLKWPIEFFDKEAGKILPRGKSDKDHHDYMMIINSKMARINEVFKIFRLQDQPLDMQTFLFELKYNDRRKDFAVYMSLKLDMRLTYNQIDKSTYRAGKGTVKKLTEFKKQIPFHVLTDNFLNQFAAFLRKKPNNNAEGTIWTRIKHVVTYIKLAEEENLLVPKSYRLYKNRAYRAPIVYLESDELNKLVMLYNSKRLGETEQNVLSAFLFSCFTGLRISDVCLAQYGWLIGNVLRFIPWKGRRFRKQIDVPVGKIALAFIEKKSGLFFNLPTHQEINRSLKTIATLAKIEKHLTFHISRHTFGTHYYRQTKDVISLQRIMGHSKIDTTMVYVHINDMDKQNGIEKMNEHFQQNANYMRVVS